MSQPVNDLNAITEDEFRRLLCRRVRSSAFLEDRPSPDNPLTCGDDSAEAWRHECDVCRLAAQVLINHRNGNPFWLADPQTGHAPLGPRDMTQRNSDGTPLHQAGMFLGLNPQGWGPPTLQPCQCRTCVAIRARNECLEQQ